MGGDDLFLASWVQAAVGERGRLQPQRREYSIELEVQGQRTAVNRKKGEESWAGKGMDS